MYEKRLLPDQETPDLLPGACLLFLHKCLEINQRLPLAVTDWAGWWIEHHADVYDGPYGSAGHRLYTRIFSCLLDVYPVLSSVTCTNLTEQLALQQLPEQHLALQQVSAHTCPSEFGQSPC